MGWKRTGYQGHVTLVSPSGETTTVYLPGRVKDSQGRLHSSYWSESPAAKRREREFYHLLSSGWKVAGDDGAIVREEEKKNTSEVKGAIQVGHQSHGGEHASAEVKDSPNHAEASVQKNEAKKGESGESPDRRSRGNRGGERGRRGRKSRNNKKVGRLIQVKRAKKMGNSPVYAPQPLEVSSALITSAEESAKLLAELIGRSHLKVRRGVCVDTERLLMALEVGDNPIPPLEAPDERPKLKILVTPDCSGSCQNWSGVGQGWATHFSHISDVDVLYIENVNGDMGEWRPDTKKLIQSVDVVIYLGDGDGGGLCEDYARLGATVLALDNHCASVGQPRLKTQKIGQGVLHWVDRVCAKTPSTWTEAVKLCLKK